MNKEKLRKIPHFISGVIILLHSFERFETGHQSYIIFLICGIVFLSLAIFHHKIASKFPLADLVFYAIEAMLSLVIAYEFYSAGKQGLPFMYIAAATLQLLAVFMFFRRPKQEQH